MGIEDKLWEFLIEQRDLLVLLLKIVIVVALAINVPPLMIWLERRAPALMQRRRGPNRVGFFKWRLWGLLQSLADAIKLIFKEESMPHAASKIFFQLSPIFGLIPALLVLCCVPFGLDLVFGSYKVPLTIVDLNVGFLYFLAMSGMAIYGVTIAGWAAGSKYSLLGSLRASAQMISYEIPMGLSLIPIVLIYESLSLKEIAIAQENVWQWGVFLAPMSFVIFLITMFAETNRAPFDLAEGESELIAGFHTEYGSAKFAAFFLSEYVSMFSLSLICSVLFFGGWQIPFVSHSLLTQLTGSYNIAVLMGTVTLFIKAAFFMWLFVWVRWTLPRFRYDQLMGLGWKFLLPLSLANIVVTALVLSVRF